MYRVQSWLHRYFFLPSPCSLHDKILIGEPHNLRSPPAVTAESGEAQLPPSVSLGGAREDEGEESFPSLQSGYRRIACLQSVSCMSESCAAGAKRRGTESGVSGPRLFIC
jgi:hypothetical protein